MRRCSTLALALAALVVAPGGASAAALHLGDRGLRPGARGHDVRVLQDFLNRDGFPVTIDGQFGPGTRAAVVAFQRAAGLTASGVVGHVTVAALRAGPPAGGVVAPPVAPSAPVVAPVAPVVAPSLTAAAAATIDAAGMAHPPEGAPQAVVDA